MKCDASEMTSPLQSQQSLQESFSPRTFPLSKLTHTIKSRFKESPPCRSLLLRKRKEKNFQDCQKQQAFPIVDTLSGETFQNSKCAILVSTQFVEILPSFRNVSITCVSSNQLQPIGHFIVTFRNLSTAPHILKKYVPMCWQFPHEHRLIARRLQVLTLLKT